MKKEIVIDGEIVHLKKDYFGWRTYDPPTKWYHYITGSKKNLILLLVIMAIALTIYLGVNEVISQYKAIAADPCAYCIDCHSTGTFKNVTLPFKV